MTGTVCTNLFPIPVFGAYAWFLSVYDRDLASSAGPFVATVYDSPAVIKLGFRPEEKQTPETESPVHRVFNGPAAGNLNVQNLLNQLGAIGKTFQLKFFERGKSEWFFQRRNELHLTSDTVALPFIGDCTPIYRVIPSLSTEEFEVREVYSGGGEQVKNPVNFEWFNMNLFPIFPLAKYSAFVCVWRQDRASSSVAIDKVGKDLMLSNFDPLPVPEGIETPAPVALVAVRKFTGAASDESVTANHRVLCDAVSKVDSLSLESQTDFRIVIDNTPNTLTQKRKSEIWKIVTMN